jgi:peptidoglycan/LPS O-acetylase OafA/YrhL
MASLNKIYRTDIDGLRAVAVISVILFHLGFLPNGYLGVDIFFVISGYLITGIVYNEVVENKFSVVKFYERRLRRIFPLVLFTCLAALILGLVFMLPDDLENLCQSVIATNFSANNILMYITSADYWAVKNDYKPLMHTWSLGIEEQFYLLYPFIFFVFKGTRKKYILSILIILSIVSLILFFVSGNIPAKFYFLHFRFFELAVGGICAIYFTTNPLSPHSKSQWLLFTCIALAILLLYTNFISSNTVKVLITTFLSAAILVTGGLHYQSSRLYNALMSNTVMSTIGKISFSLYMWHQLVFAFSRYFLVEEINLAYGLILSLVVLGLSFFSYYTIENPFRNRKKMRTKPLLVIIGLAFIIINGAAFYIYAVGGIVKDVPQLGLTVSNRPTQLNLFDSKSNINIQYNENIRALDKPFSQTAGKIKVLVLGNSFARDVANILLESSFKHDIEVRYADLAEISSQAELETRISEADHIFFGSTYPNPERIATYKIDMRKVTIVGTKDFGNSNGIHYNKQISDYSNYRTWMKKGYLEKNQVYKMQWGDKYIDLVALIADNNGKVLVFTPDGKFLSQDTAHLTKQGAVFFAALLEAKLKAILGIP